MYYCTDLALQHREVKSQAQGLTSTTTTKIVALKIIIDRMSNSTHLFFHYLVYSCTSALPQGLNDFSGL